jgi:glutamate-1-semialdehyde aminotransferase/acyl carrier protein
MATSSNGAASGASRRTALLGRLKSVAADLSGLPAVEMLEGASFFELGFDSLVLTQLAQAFQKEHGVRLTFRQLIDELPTLDAVAAHLDRALPADTPLAAREPAAAPAAAASPAQPPAVPSTSPSTLAPVAALLPSMPIANGAMRAGTDALQAIFAQQLQLMSQQLAMLTGAALSVGAPVAAESAPAAAPAEAAQASEATIPTAAPDLSAAPESAPAVPILAPVKKSTDSTLTPHQQKRLAAFVQRYTARTAKSKEHTQTHRAVHADPRTASGFNRWWKEIVYPVVVERSFGSKLWDLDGNEYVDLLNGFGPNFLGHSAPFVTAAIREQLERGFEVGPQSPLAGEVAQLVCELTGMDRASLVCTGSEAVQAAIRLSRTVTGRDKIVVFTRDYHGNFDEVLVRSANAPGKLRTVPSAPGIPFRAVEDVIVLDYGTDESLTIIRSMADELAAVIVEPVQSRRPELQPKEFLLELRQITEKSGALLVFDEVVTGFRIRPGGAQEYFGIEADLATYGKVLAGGMPMGVVAGRARFMDTFDGGTWQYGDDSFPQAGVTFFAGTFVRHPLAVAAAHATLSYIRSAGHALYERLNATAADFATRVNAVLRDAEAPFEYPHFGSQLFLRHTDDHELDSLLFYVLRSKGVHILEGFPSYLTIAHTPEDLDLCVRAFAEAVDEMHEAGFFRNSRARTATMAAAPAAHADAAPVPGARLGRDPDGTPAWFVADPQRPNKYLRVAAAV